ncbi:MAG: hypothetical protein HYZ92_02200 [Candidatus Omnitrophica bacterium]|nr:hypothetical protein [Candidatus Omnitrophota bacterium]
MAKNLIIGTALGAVIFAAAPACFADKLVLKSGKEIEGVMIEKTPDYVRIKESDGVAMKYLTEEITQVQQTAESSQPVKAAEQPQVLTGEAAREVVKQLEQKAKMAKPYRCRKVETTIKTQQSGPARTDVSTVWGKGLYRRTEGTMHGQPSVSVVTPDTSYIRIGPEDHYSALPSLGWADEPSPKNEFVVLGTELIDGKQATVVQSSASGKIGKLTLKSWVWNDTGLELKSEMCVSDRACTTTEYKDFVFEDVPDSVFDVPKEKIIR